MQTGFPQPPNQGYPSQQFYPQGNPSFPSQQPYPQAPPVPSFQQPMYPPQGNFASPQPATGIYPQIPNNFQQPAQQGYPMQSPPQQGYPMQSPPQQGYPMQSNQSFGGEVPVQQHYASPSFSHVPQAGGGGSIKKVSDLKMQYWLIL